MQMKKITLTLLALASLAVGALAGDIYRIHNYNSLVTAQHGDLVTFMSLNDRGLKSAVRAMYRNLENTGALFNLQPGIAVEVAEYYTDGTARIVWSREGTQYIDYNGNEDYCGYIAKADLSEYLGSR